MSSISESPKDENCNKAIDATKDYKLSDNNASENVIPLEDSSLVRETSEDAGTSKEGSASSSSTAAPTSSKAKKNWLRGSKLASIVGSVGSSETAAKSKKMTLKSVAKRVNRQIKAMTLIKKWAQTTSHSQFATDSDHLNYMRNAAKDATIELPEPLIAGVRDEVLPILQDTLKQYKTQLGANHHLTQEMQARIQKLREESNYCSVKDMKRDTAFFRSLSTLIKE